MKAYTDLEQSKKLSEILPAESADMVYIKHSSSDNPTWEFNEDFPPMILGNIPISEMTVEVLPCWSLAALLNLLPSEFIQKDKYSTTTYKIDIRKYKFTDDIDLHQIAYGSIKFDVDGQYSFKDMINTGEKENLIDACYETIVKLKELNLI